MHRHAIHGAMLLAVVLAVGSAGVATTFMMGLLSGEQVVATGAGVAYSITLLLCAAYAIASIRSFVIERRVGHEQRP